MATAQTIIYGKGISVRADTLPAVRLKATGRAGRLVGAIPIGTIGTIMQLAFTGQHYTECHWDSEVEPITEPEP